MTLFRSMVPDRDSTTHPENLRKAILAGEDLGEWVACDKCKGGWRTGGWPWCRGAGYEADHMR